MSPFRRPGARRRAIALLLMSLSAAGCTTWQTAKVTPQVLLETEKPKSVRVTAQDDTRQVLRGPRIATDTLRGLRGWNGKDSVAVAVTDIGRIERQRVSPARTVVLLAILGGVIAGAVAMGSMQLGLSFGY